MSALGQKQTCAAQNGMSALPPKADMCGATRDVRFGPIADIDLSQMTRSARARSPSGTVMPRTFAVRKFIDSSICVGCSTGKSAGFAQLVFSLRSLQSDDTWLASEDRSL